MRPHPTLVSLGVLLALAAPAPLLAQKGPDEAGFSARVQPFLKTYCYECHKTTEAKGGVDLEMFSTARAFEDHPTKLDHAIMVIEDGDMPPRKAKQPPESEKDFVLNWLQAELARQQNASPNDPGPVVMARINHKEYDNVVRDLTGRRLAMGQFLTADTGGGEGFLNVGAALPMQSGNFESFLATGKKLLGHARITPGAGFVWFDAPQPPGSTPEEITKALATSYKDWFEAEHSREALGQIETAKKQKASASSFYLEAAWRYHHRALLGMPQATFADIAKTFEFPLYPDAIAKTYALVTRDPAHASDLKEALENPLFQEYLKPWAALPVPRSKADLQLARKDIRAMDEIRARFRAQDTDFGARYASFEIGPKGREEGQQFRGYYQRGVIPYRFDLTKMKGNDLYLVVASTWDGKDGDFVRWSKAEITLADGSKKKLSQVVPSIGTASGQPLRWGTHAGGGKAGPDEFVMPSGTWVKLTLPDGAKRLEITGELDPEKGRDSSVQIDQLDRPPTADELVAIKGRPIIGDNLKDRKKLQRAKNAIQQLASWDDAFAANRRMYPTVVFGHLPPALQSAYIGKDKRRGGKRWFNWTLYSVTRDDVIARASPSARAELEGLDRLLADHAATAAQPASQFAVQAKTILQDFMTRAWRRPPTAEELQTYGALFTTEAAVPGTSFEAALKTPLTGVLISAPFLYRITEARGLPEAYPLRDHELATKLAFTLWASLPDKELLDLANAGKLQDPATLAAQTKRLLADPRSSGFVEQFLGIWLSFADFDSFGGPDAEKFKDFSDPLKQAMHQEASLFLGEILRADLPLSTALDADYTYLNGVLAKHYGIPGVDGPEMRKVKVPTDQRGGILGMGAFLTTFSKPLRTSPVHRGIWVYENVLGLKLAEPPANVPQLSDEEKSEAGLTIAQQLEQHRSNPACFSCHDKFDPLGVALESFDPVGRWRTTIEGSPVDNLGKFASGPALNGFVDLKKYVVARRAQFTAAFNRKLLAYAVGRPLLPSDKPLLEDMAAAMKKSGDRPQAALLTLVQSKQFRYRRDDLRPDLVATNP